MNLGHCLGAILVLLVLFRLLAVVVCAMMLASGVLRDSWRVAFFQLILDVTSEDKRGFKSSL